mgnify:CR=1 FL=1
MLNPIIRRLPSSEANLLLDELFLSRGLKARPHIGGHIITVSNGPVLRTLDLPNGWTLLYFHPTYFREPFNGV